MRRSFLAILLGCSLAIGAHASGIQIGASRAAGPCAGCAAGVVNLMLTPSFRVEEPTKARLIPAFQTLSDWLKTADGRYFLKTNPSWRPLAGLSFDQPETAAGVISVGAISPLMAVAARPTLENGVVVDEGKVERLINRIQELAEDPKNNRRKNVVFASLEMLRQDPDLNIQEEVRNFMKTYLLQEPPMNREELRTMLADVEGVLAFLSHLDLYRYDDRYDSSITQAREDAARRKKDLQEILGRDLMAGAGRTADGLAKSGQEDAVETRGSGKAAQPYRLKPSGKKGKLDMAWFETSDLLRFGDAKGRGIEFRGSYRKGWVKGAPGFRNAVPGSVVFYQREGRATARVGSPFYVELGGHRLARPKVSRREMAAREIEGFIEAFEEFVVDSEKRRQIQGLEPDHDSRSVLVEMKIAARKQRVRVPPRRRS